MKTTTLFMALAILTMAYTANAQPQVDTLTNEKIIQLSKIGLESSVIINKIQTSFTLFDVSTDGLIDLSNNGVRPEVINEMMKIDTEVKAAQADQKDMNDPNTMRSPGIYYHDPSNLKEALIQVDAAVVSTNKIGGGISISSPLGSSSEKVRSTLAGSNSRLQINESQPVFYFYFQNDENARADSWFFASATSPNEFALVNLKEKGKNREMVVAKVSANKEVWGVPDNVKVPFNYTKEADGVYKVFFDKPLKEGEYCFLYASTVPSRGSNDKVFDFGFHEKD